MWAQVTYQTPRVATFKAVKSPTKMEARLQPQATYIFYVSATQLEEERRQWLHDQTIYQTRQRAPLFEEGVCHHLGKMNIMCWHCDVFHWMAKKLANDTLTNPLFGTCCHKGKNSLPLFQQPPRMHYNSCLMEMMWLQRNFTIT